MGRRSVTVANANKGKGTRWESALRDYFRGLGLNAYRPAQEGRDDVGDLHGLDPFVGQAKDWKDTVSALRVGTDGAEVQARNAHRDYGVNFVKRARTGTGRGYAVMTVRTFALVLTRLRRAEDLLATKLPKDYEAHLDAVYDDLRNPGA
jgi:hypothetical protein